MFVVKGFGTVPLGRRLEQFAETTLSAFGSITNRHVVRGYRFSSAFGRGGKVMRVVKGVARHDEAKLALRAVIGARELDSFLTAKDGVAKELEEVLRPRATTLGFELIAAGIRDVILPGEMKTLLNRVTEAKKTAEANLIVRREETAAMRSQANTAKLLEDTPTLMRLRELEILEKVAASSKLNVVLGEKGLAERVVNLL